MNLLFVSLAFPPKNDPECIQTARYFKYLSKDSNLTIDVVTSSSPTLFMPVDIGLRKYDKGYRQKIEITVFESKLFNFIVRKLGLTRILFPDSKMTFHWQWKKVVSRLKEKPDLIYSRSNPMSSSVMALKLKKYFQVPWVMHMSDPWAISPLEELSDAEKSKALAMEEELLGEADKVTFTSVQTLNYYAARYQKYATRFSVLPNVYDPEDRQETIMPESKKLKVVYTGGLAGKRDVVFLDQVIRNAAHGNAEVLDSVEFVFAGDMDSNNRAFFAQVQACMKHVGILSHAEAMALCQSAHILLVVDNPATRDTAIFFPSKLLDYFLIRRKIWAVTPAGSVTRDVLLGTNHVAFDRSDTEAMTDFLLESIRQCREGESSGFQSNSIPEQFNAELNARTLSGYLQQAATK